MRHPYRPVWRPPSSPTQINLSWNASTDNVGVTGYVVLTNGTIEVGAPATSFQDTGLARGSTYTYSVAARDAAGNISPLSAPVSAATPAFVITNVESSGITSSRATITWTTDQPANSQVEYGPTTSYRQLTSFDPTLVASHSQTVSGLTPNNTYHYRVRSETPPI